MKGKQFRDETLGGIGYWVKRQAELSPLRPALADLDQSLTWGELNSRVNQLAHALLARGIAHGDRVAGLLWNGIPFLEAIFATAKLGAILVPINFRLSEPEVRYILSDSGARLLLCHDSFYPIAEAVMNGDNVIRVADPGTSRTHSPYESLLAAFPDTEPQSEVKTHDIHVMMYTSGTTGKPKGAQLSHRNATWNAIQLMLHEATLRVDDTVLTVAPLFHIGGLGVHTLPAMYLGAFVIVLSRFNPQEVLETIQNRHITALFLVPAMWLALSQVPDFDHYDLSSLRVLVSGGAPCPIPLIEFYQSRGLTFLEGFGMTETAPITMILGSADAIRKHGSIGRPLFYQGARVVDESDRDVATDEVGELVLQGPNIFEGYWNMPQATQDAFRGSWFHTGDLARVDPEGFFYLVDRKKDLLISGGENVYPVEVEQVLVRHPNIVEAAVIGVPDLTWGEVPLAVLVLKDASQNLRVEDIQQFCQGRLAGFKIPKTVRVVASLPRNATGKVLKTMLRQIYAKEGDA